jgi:hypothetical protein
MNAGDTIHGPEFDQWFIRTYDDDSRFTMFTF